MGNNHDLMDKKFWKKRIEQTLKQHGKDKLLTKMQVKKLVKKIRKA